MSIDHQKMGSKLLEHLDMFPSKPGKLKIIIDNLLSIIENANYRLITLFLIVLCGLLYLYKTSQVSYFETVG